MFFDPVVQLYNGVPYKLGRGVIMEFFCSQRDSALEFLPMGKSSFLKSYPLEKSMRLWRFASSVVYTDILPHLSLLWEIVGVFFVNAQHRFANLWWTCPLNSLNVGMVYFSMLNTVFACTWWSCGIPWNVEWRIYQCSTLLCWLDGHGRCTRKIWMVYFSISSTLLCRLMMLSGFADRVLLPLTRELVNKVWEIFFLRQEIK